MKETLHVNTRSIIRPAVGVPFDVDYRFINWSLFEMKREDKRQEETRQLIQEAYCKMSAYRMPFKTLIPEKTWDWKTVGELEKYASIIGDHIADWIEQSMELAQRISNGESWEEVCNNPDTLPNFRLIKWKGKVPWLGGTPYNPTRYGNYYRLIGGSRENGYFNPPASYIHDWNYYDYTRVDGAVPSIVLYE